MTVCETATMQRYVFLRYGVLFTCCHHSKNHMMIVKKTIKKRTTEAITDLSDTAILDAAIQLLKAEKDHRNRYDYLQTLTAQIETNLLIFPTFLRTAIKSVCHTFNAPTPFYIASTLTAISTAIGKNVTITDGRGVQEKAALYMCIVSDSGTGKTPAAQWCINPIRRIESENHAAYTAKEIERWDLVYEESQKPKAEQDFSEIPKEEPMPPAHYITDATTEALVKQLNDSHSVLYFRDELIGWLKDMNKYRQSGGSDDLLFMQIWNSNDTIRVERQSKSILIENPYLNVLGGTQPRRLQEFLKKSATDSGFFQRILFVYPDAEIQDRRNVKEDKEAKQQYNEIITNIFNNCKSADFTFKLTDESNEYVTTFVNDFLRYQQRSYRSNPLHVETLSKLETYILRFALIHEITETEAECFNDTVSHKSVIKAVATVLYFYSQSLKVLSFNELSKDYENDSDRVIHKILSKHLSSGDIFTTKNALDFCGRTVSKPTLIKHLKTSAFYEKVSRGKYEFI